MVYFHFLEIYLYVSWCFQMLRKGFYQYIADKDTINHLRILMKIILFKSRTNDWCTFAAHHNPVVSSWDYLIFHWLEILSSTRQLLVSLQSTGSANLLLKTKHNNWTGTWMSNSKVYHRDVLLVLTFICCQDHFLKLICGFCLLKADVGQHEEGS